MKDIIIGLLIYLMIVTIVLYRVIKIEKKSKDREDNERLKQYFERRYRRK